ncbi:MAG: DNA polymerase IV [Verrucomicrobia bacterium]|nr:DNA polymerase IV [Verrucomicrobiota bacterium]
MRKIIHIDMDCFFAAVECRDDPSVAAKPVGVGGAEGRSVLTTCNYEARKYGCRSAMPVYKARQLCPHLIIKPIRFSAYRAESAKIRAIFKIYTGKIEPLSLDEAYLDVSHRPEYAWQIAREIRKKIWKETQLTASAGVSCNKMLAKIASDWKKPNGQFAILPEDIESFMETLPVQKIYGVGPKSAARLQAMGFKTCGQLQTVPLNELHRHFGPAWGTELYKLCRGQDDRPVEATRLRKSMSTETTFQEDLTTIHACLDELPELVDELNKDLGNRKSKEPIVKVFLKLKFADFKTTTKECAGETVTVNTYIPLLEEAFERNSEPVRLLGVGVKFENPSKIDERQLELFT